MRFVYRKEMTLVVAGFLMCLMLFVGCNDDHYHFYKKGYKSMFTVKVEDDSYYFLSDKGRIFTPVHDLRGYTPKRDHRAIVYYEVALEVDCDCDYPIYVHRIDPVLTKQLAENLGEDNDKKYGKDPVKISRMYIGGGYLNIKFTTYWGGYVAHFVNMVQEDEDDPFTLTFRHNAYNDPERYAASAWVAFDLNSLPISGIEDDEIELTIKVRTFEGMREYTIKYNPDAMDEGEENDEDDSEEVISAMMI